MGLARQKVLDATPSDYPDLNDVPLAAIQGDLYRARGFPVASSKTSAKTSQADDDRHGWLGGANPQWSSGLVGSGTFFGHDVDMLKQSATPNGEAQDDDSEQYRSVKASDKDVMAQHILDRGWDYLDEKDEQNTLKLLAEAEAEGTWDKLPLRDQVRGDPDKERQAAQGWANIYTAMNGHAVKSALELSIERLVRRSPIVVFSKTYCPSVASLPSR